MQLGGVLETLVQRLRFKKIESVVKLTRIG